VSAAAPADRRLRLKLVAAFAVIYFVWGSTFLGVRLGVRALPPFLFGGGRFLLAGSLLALVALLLRERFPAARGEWRPILFMSFVMIALGNGMTTYALQYVPSNETALLAASSALWIAALGALGPRGHELTPRGLLGLLLGFAGVALIVWPHGSLPSGRFGWQSLVLLGSLAGAVGTIIYRDAALTVGPTAFNALMMLLGGLWMLMFGLATGETARWQWDAGGLAALVYLALFGSAVAFSAYTWLLKRVPADRVATYAYVNPAVAAALGWAVLGEALTAPQVAGMLVVLLGVALVTLQGK
jgi:drug/metabolite transporter (DMT)-like permease